MQFLKGSVRFFPLCLVMCVISASALAHDVPPKQDSTVLLEDGETLSLAFWADCKGPEDSEDASIVPPVQRQVSFNLVAEGVTPGSSQELYGFVFAIDMLPGTTEKVELPASMFGTFLRLRVEQFSSQGGCRVLTAGSTRNANGGGGGKVDISDLGIMKVVDHSTSP